ncbi:uncharacterized protein DUF2752 [Rhodococcus sp. AG1013]|uniref:DUF2752 domain-containing protein n=1 Tax=Rhodococcus sp. AG1013 TaxID=2183996 RepID=UPI000E0CBA45|nr:DUF2752 domain-containing protein [Rhodococcus sp. AG1013]RDI30471.1 uncharacterized protein DUF2752 [Rhodococcus sp. AG1013]
MESTPKRLTLRLAAPAAVAAAAVAACGFVLWADPTMPGGVIPVCPTKALLGIDCPLCGGTRMLYSLLHFDLSDALRYNASGVVVAVLLLAGYGAWTWGRFRGRRVLDARHLRRIPAVALAAAAIWFVLRNIPIAPFTGLQV